MVAPWSYNKYIFYTLTYVLDTTSALPNGSIKGVYFYTHCYSRWYVLERMSSHLEFDILIQN